MNYSKSFVRFLLVSSYFAISTTLSFSQVCAALNSWSQDSNNGDGTCTYTISIDVDSGSNSQGTATFTLNGTTVHTENNCRCNPSTITFPVTVTCNSVINIAVNYNGQGNGNNDCTGSTGPITLPVQWLDFTLEKQGNHHLLKWSAIEDDLHSKYIVERGTSPDNFIGIQEITQSDAAIGEILHYEFMDKRPLNGISYYRIKQVDYDNKISFSDIIRIQNNDLGTLQVFPNPFDATLEIEGISEITWKIFNAYGLLILEGQDSKINTAQLPKGLYYLEVRHNGISEIKPIIKT